MDWLKRSHALFKAEDTDGDSAGRSPDLLLPLSQLVSGKQAGRTAFSLAELVLIVAILGVFAVIAIPRFDYGTVRGYKAETTAKKIVTSLRLGRSLAISEAAHNSKGFDLNMLGVEPGPYTGYEIENSDTRAIVSTCTIDPDVTVTGDIAFKFEPLGYMQTGDGQLSVSAAGKSFTISVLGATGLATCVEN